MGPLLLAGLAAFGSCVAIGILAAGTPRPTGTARLAGPIGLMPNSPRFAVILCAFASGGGLWGVFAALLAATNGSIADRTGAILIPVLPIAGAVVALALLMGSFSRLDPWLLVRAAAFLVPQVVLPIVAALLTILIPSEPASPGVIGAVLPFAVLGLVSAGATIGLGLAGVRGVQGLAAFDAKPPDDPDVRRLTSAILIRCLPFELLAIGAAAVGIILVVQAGA